MAVQQVLNNTRLDDSHLAAISRLLLEHDETRSGYLSLVGDLATHALSLIPPPAVSGGATTTSDRIGNFLIDLSGILRIYQIGTFQSSQEQLAVQQLPTHQRLEAWDQLALAHEEASSGRMLASIMLSSHRNMMGLQFRTMAQYRTAAAALAVERYRLANSNQLPDTLDQLVPTYIEAVPLDPFTGNPLLYAKTPENHYTVYSTGADAIDHGGARYNPAGDELEPGSDVVFEVRR